MNARHTLYLPLHGIRVVEFEGIGPGPLAGRMLADMGAEVIALVRSEPVAAAQQLGGAAENPLRRGKQIEVVDLKSPGGRMHALDLVTQADALIEGYRPGVMERLGLGPADCAERNPKLVYGRMTGWGQDGPLAQTAGHDLNYIALTGLLSLSARKGQAPIVPPTVLGDATGALGMAFGIVCALVDARAGGRGRVVDAAIVDIVAMLGTLVQWIRANGQIDGAQASPFHDSPFYDVYACADGSFVSLAAVEPPFYALLLSRLGLTDVNPADQYDKAAWPALKERIATLIRGQPRKYWCELLEGSDACFAPVLDLAEAVRHPHNAARQIYQSTPSGVIHVAPAPRFQVLDTITPETNK
ncbi:CaiB/BaiF CoA transferase family protein [Ralstonia flatus]|uniref:Acetyl-CoA:oxalate CoA-transferase n=1 Tax=Ralstonia flatus TaxID=3058601 RepID=A0ABM9L0N5_9RALS|nr:CaiB/BaiF CoA-transferase family protein [Ralstonia sp. LMG 32965]CAJ0895715.1 Acetyl-CoA:oxalate CoA-transferase [Ralstonia sp. LMG 32965]